MLPMMRRVLAGFVVALGGCGPIAYVGTVSHDASRAVEAAREVHADTLSPYYWTRALLYLHMAREVAGHADFQGANRFGRLSAQAAEIARGEALAFKADPASRPYLDSPATPAPLAPAKPVAP